MVVWKDYFICLEIDGNLFVLYIWEYYAKDKGEVSIGYTAS